MIIYTQKKGVDNMAQILELVGKRIRQIRKARGLSQEALAEKCGFNFSYIGGIERAEKNVSLINLSKIADALEVGIHQFFVFSHKQENLTDKEQALIDLSFILLDYDISTIEMVKNVVQEILKNHKKR